MLQHRPLNRSNSPSFDPLGKRPRRSRYCVSTRMCCASGCGALPGGCGPFGIFQVLMAGRNNPGLFDDIAALPAPPPDLVTLGSRIPASIKLGTSTWTYDGWTGDVYRRAYRGAQPARRLEEYARYPLFRVVGIDSAFYEPPSEEVLAAYARALPAGFPCVSKVWDRITARRFNQDARWGNLAGQRKPNWLRAGVAQSALHVSEPQPLASSSHWHVLVVHAVA